MKRSEALLIIERRLIEEADGYYKPDRVNKYAKLILKDLEEAGMQPPRDKILLVNRWEKE